MGAGFQFFSLSHASRESTYLPIPKCQQTLIGFNNKHSILSESGNWKVLMDGPWDQEGESRDNRYPNYGWPFIDVPPRVADPIEGH